MNVRVDWKVDCGVPTPCASVLDAFDMPVMVVRKDRMVLAANRAARNHGVHPQSYCWYTLAQCQYVPKENRKYFEKTGHPMPGTCCAHCKADDSLARDAPIRFDRALRGGRWESQCIPLSSTTFLYIVRSLEDAKQEGGTGGSDQTELEWLYGRIRALEHENRRLDVENRQLRQWQEQAVPEEVLLLPETTGATGPGKRGASIVLLSNTHFRSAFESAAHGMALVSTDGRWLKVNQALCAITGYEQRELLARSFQEITHPDDLEQDQAYAQRMLSGEIQTYHREKRYLHKKGHTVWVLLSASLVRDDQGAPLLFVSQIIDIDARKNYETQLAYEHLLMRSLIDSIPDLIFIKDNFLRLVGCNKAFEKRAGLSEQEMVGKNCFDLFPPEEASAYYESDREMLEKGTSISIEEAVESGGEMRHYETIKTPFYDASGEPLGLIGVCRDITDRKKNEAALQAAMDEAKQASQVKSEFLANMSHEIRTPMHTILGMCELLQETPLTEKQHRYLRSMKRSGRMLLTIINDILDLSKIEAGQFALECIPFSLGQLIDDVLQLFEFSAKNKGIVLKKQVEDGGIDSVLGDPNRLRQVLVNLLGNALKFTEQGSVTLAVEQSVDTGQTVIAVADTGPGIPLERQEEIFLPFQQADTSITRRHGGTGLGLTICRHFVELMGGRLELNSVVGQGSVFSFAISLPPSDKPAGPLAGESHTPCLPAAHVSTGVDVLLVEDTEEVSMVIEAYLHTTAHHLVVVRNGAEAVAMVQSRPFDVVLMDLQMPVMDGYAATQAIRAWEQKEGRTPLPILALTAHALAEERVRIQAAGFNVHLTKPIGKQCLLDCIATYAGSRSG